MISTIASVVGPFAITTAQSPIISYNLSKIEANEDDFHNDHRHHDVNSSIVDVLSTFETSTPVSNATEGDYPQIPAYIRMTSMVLCVIIMCLGVVGNVMVPIVIMKTKDMRNSTNIFLMNLSIADLMVLLICTPTVFVEVNTKPDTWVLGKEMCLAVPFVELTVAHASVLTILAISFERYYAICEPLKAGYVCTKTRATLICFLAWFVAAVFTSPILAVADYKEYVYPDGNKVHVCLTQAADFWPTFYFLMTISLFFLAPFFILLVLYTIIAKNLISTASKVVMNKHVDGYNFKARRQVVLMLGTVILSFFICEMPFKLLTLWIIIVPDETLVKLGAEKYYNILYFSRIMLYLNSAVNPILYNLMSSKFRDGFLLVCRIKKKHQLKNYKRGYRHRAGTFHTTSTTCTSSSVSRRSSSLKHAIFKRASFDSSLENSSPVLKMSILEARKNAGVESETKKVSRLNRSISVLPNMMLLKDEKANHRSERILEEDENQCDICEENSDIKKMENEQEKVSFIGNKGKLPDSAANGRSTKMQTFLKHTKSKSVEEARDNMTRESFV